MQSLPRSLRAYSLLFLSLLWSLKISSSSRTLLQEKCDRLSQLQSFEKKIFSQNGEDGVILTLLDILGIHNRYFVEFGVEDGSECNTRVLRERLNFTGLLMDGGYFNENINLQTEFITTENILALFSKYNVPTVFDVLSVDIDFYDWWILLRILRDSAYRPRIIVVETNPALCMEQLDIRYFIREYAQFNAEPLVVPPPEISKQEGWDGSRHAGANPAAFRKLADRFGYEMVYCDRCGVNCFLVQRSALQDCNWNHSNFGTPFVPYPCFGTASGGGYYPGHPQDKQWRSPLLITDNALDTLANGSVSEGYLQSQMYACSSRYPQWGQDWCSFFYQIALPPDCAGRTYEAVDGVGELLDVCQMLLLGSNYLDSGMFGDAKAVYEVLAVSDAWPPCQTGMRSEVACVVRAKLYYNYGMALLHVGDLQAALIALENAKSHNEDESRIQSVWEFLSFMNSNNSLADAYDHMLFDMNVPTQHSSPLTVTVGIGGGMCDDIQERVQAVESMLGFRMGSDMKSEITESVHSQLRRGLLGNSPYDILSPFLSADQSHVNMGRAPVPDCFQAAVRSAPALRNIGEQCAALSASSQTGRHAVLVLGPPSASIGLVAHLLSVSFDTNFQQNGNSVGAEDNAGTEAINSGLLESIGCDIDVSRIAANCAGASALVSGQVHDVNAIGKARAGEDDVFKRGAQKVYSLDTKRTLTKYNGGLTVNVYADWNLAYTLRLWETSLRNVIEVVVLAPPGESVAWIMHTTGCNVDSAADLWLDYTNSMLASIAFSKKILFLEVSSQPGKKTERDAAVRDMFAALWTEVGQSPLGIGEDADRQARLAQMLDSDIHTQSQQTTAPVRVAGAPGWMQACHAAIIQSGRVTDDGRRGALPTRCDKGR